MLCPPRPKGTRARQQKTPLDPPGGQEAIGLPRFHSCFSLEGLVTGPNRGASASPSLPGARSPAFPQGGLQSVAAPLCPVLAGYSSRSSRDELFAPVSYHGPGTLSRERPGFPRSGVMQRRGGSTASPDPVGGGFRFGCGISTRRPHSCSTPPPAPAASSLRSRPGPW